MIIQLSMLTMHLGQLGVKLQCSGLMKYEPLSEKEMITGLEARAQDG